MARTLHVVMLPWPAFGHLMPFFELSVALANSGVKVSFISTPRNIERIPKPPSNLATLINFVEFPLPVSANHNDMLLQGAEATVDISFDKIQYLKIAYDLLQHPVKQFLAEQSPDWIICDVVTHWAANLAKECQVPLALFSVFAASVYAFLGPDLMNTDDDKKFIRQSPESLTRVPEWVDFSSLLAYRSFEAIGAYAGFYGRNASGISDIRRVANVLQVCQGIAIRSSPEFEGEYLNLLEKIIGKPTIPVGLLPPKSTKQRGQTPDGLWKNIFKWLDEQKPKSVVFVGFGSECKLTKDQVYEMAYGLELSGLQFLWGLRKPEWAIDDEEALPSGFNDRIHGKGIVCIGWVPQLEILGHPSIGGSMFHAGWGSVIETLQFGHSLVVLPFIVDQPLNARVLVEKGLAVEVERREDGSFTGDNVAKALRLAMVSEEGEKLRGKAREASGIFSDKKLHNDYFDKFVDFLKKNTVNKQE